MLKYLSFFSPIFGKYGAQIGPKLCFNCGAVIQVCFLLNFSLLQGQTQLLYILTNIWVLHTPNAAQKILFHIFCKKVEKGGKARKLVQNMS